MLQIKQFTFNPFAENTYVLYNDDKRACIIDPGCYFPEEMEELEAYVAENNLKVDYLLLTHAHLDHVFGLKRMVAAYKLTPLMHPLEQPVLERGPQAALMYGVPFHAYTGITGPLADDQKISIGTDELQVLFAPGHSPGHVCFFCPQQGFLVGGDVLFQRSIGRTDLPGGNFETLIRSIRQRLFTLPDSTIVYSGHGYTTTIGEERLFNPFLT